jgi:hypothetical protein
MTTDNATSRWEQQKDGSFVPERIFSYRDTPTDNGGWQAPTYGTNAGAQGTPWFGVQFRKDRHGYVHLRGNVLFSGAVAPGATILTLPAGYRPGVQHRQVSWGSPGGTEQALRLDIVTDGTVFSNATFANTNWVSLSGIHYLAEG